MKVTINDDQQVNFPTSLADITLGQRIDFYLEHGKLLEEMRTDIMKIEDETDREIEMASFLMEKIYRTFAFFSGCPLEAVKESDFHDDVIAITMASMHTIFENQDLDPKSSFHWKGEEWTLENPELKQDSKLSFGEFIDSRQMIQDMTDENCGKIETLLPLCAIYLRKKGEAYQESFLYENSERLQLMRELPMDVALNVFFSMNGRLPGSVTDFHFFSRAEQKALENIQRSISRIGDG
jgi:hypothetical protein